MLVDLGSLTPGNGFCFECGGEMEISAAELVSICDACKPSWQAAQSAPALSTADEPGPLVQGGEPPSDVPNDLAERLGSPRIALEDGPAGAFAGVESLPLGDSLEAPAQDDEDSGEELALRSMESLRESSAFTAPPAAPAPPRAQPAPPAAPSAATPPDEPSSGFSLRSEGKVSALAPKVRRPEGATARADTGSDGAMPTEAVINFKRQTPVRDFVSSLGRGLVALVILGGAAAGVWWAVEAQVTVLPQETVEGALKKLRGLGGETSAPAEVAVPDEFDGLLDQLRLEHRDFLGDYDGSHSAMEYCLTGRSRTLSGANEELALARQALERSVLLDPDNSLALAGLAQVYALQGASDASRSALSVRVLWVLNRADSVGGYALERERARVVWLLSGDSHGEALRRIRDALALQPDDGHFHFLHGIAQASDASAIDPAIGAFRRALEIEPEMDRVWLEIGRLEDTRHHYAAAVEAYRTELKSEPDSSESHRSLGLVLERVGKYSEAAEHFERSVELDSSQPDLSIRRAAIAYQVEGNPSEAIEVLGGVLEGSQGVLREEERQQARVHLSAAQRSSGDLEAAIRFAEEALVEDKAYSPALFHLGLAQIASGRVDEGEGSLLRLDASGLSSLERSRIHFHSGRAALERGRTQDALAAFTRAIDARPDFVPAYLWATVPLLGRGDDELQVESMFGFMGRDPVDWSRPRDLGLFWAPLPSLRPLTAKLEQAASGREFAPNLKLALGVLSFHEGLHSQAERALKAALVDDSGSAGASFYLGLLALSRGNNGEAVARFEHLVRIAHNNGIYHAYLGEAQRRAGSAEAAQKSFERARAYGDGFPWIETRYALVQAESGQSEEAIRSLERAASSDARAVDPRSQRYAMGL